MSGSLIVRPLTLKQANAFITEHHRHHSPVQGHRFSLSCECDGAVLGVAVIGRPVARRTHAYHVAEVTRLCTDGSKNVCSKLYSAAARAAKAMGFDSIQTFILATENGASLRASGWERGGESAGGSWNVPSRARITPSNTAALGVKVLWFRTLQGASQ